MALDDSRNGPSPNARTVRVSEPLAAGHRHPVLGSPSREPSGAYLGR
jgi:hypothetical protein